MNMLEISLLLAALLCALVAGFTFAFATVVMPGLERLGDRAYLVAFKAVDGVIQEGQAIFGLVWVGSGLSLIAAAVLGTVLIPGPARLLPLAAAAIYIALVQVPTFTRNVPLNNRLQNLDLETLDDETIRRERQSFDATWLRWNTIRTVFATLTAVLLMLSLAML